MADDSLPENEMHEQQETLDTRKRIEGMALITAGDLINAIDYDGTVEDLSEIFDRMLTSQNIPDDFNFEEGERAVYESAANRNRIRMWYSYAASQPTLDANTIKGFSNARDQLPDNEFGAAMNRLFLGLLPSDQEELQQQGEQTQMSDLTPEQLLTASRIEVFSTTLSDVNKAKPKLEKDMDEEDRKEMGRLIGMYQNKIIGELETYFGEDATKFFELQDLNKESAVRISAAQKKRLEEKFEKLNKHLSSKYNIDEIFAHAQVIPEDTPEQQLERLVPPKFRAELREANIINPVEFDLETDPQPVELILNGSVLSSVREEAGGGTVFRSIGKRVEKTNFNIQVGDEIWGGAKIDWVQPVNRDEKVLEVINGENPTKVCRIGKNGEIQVVVKTFGPEGNVVSEYELETASSHSTVIIPTAKGYSIRSNGAFRGNISQKDIDSVNGKLMTAESGHVVLQGENGGTQVVGPNQAKNKIIKTAKGERLIVLKSGHVAKVKQSFPDQPFSIEAIFAKGEGKDAGLQNGDFTINDDGTYSIAYDDLESGETIVETYNREGELGGAGEVMAEDVEEAVDKQNAEPDLTGSDTPQQDPDAELLVTGTDALVVSPGVQQRGIDFEETGAGLDQEAELDPKLDPGEQQLNQLVQPQFRAKLTEADIIDPFNFDLKSDLQPVELILNHVILTQASEEEGGGSTLLLINNTNEINKISGKTFNIKVGGEEWRDATVSWVQPLNSDKAVIEVINQADPTTVCRLGSDGEVVIIKKTKDEKGRVIGEEIQTEPISKHNTAILAIEGGEKEKYVVRSNGRTVSSFLKSELEDGRLQIAAETGHVVGKGLQGQDFVVAPQQQNKRENPSLTSNKLISYPGERLIVLNSGYVVKLQQELRSEEYKVEQIFERGKGQEGGLKNGRFIDNGDGTYSILQDGENQTFSLTFDATGTFLRTETLKNNDADESDFNTDGDADGTDSSPDAEVDQPPPPDTYVDMPADPEIIAQIDKVIPESVQLKLQDVEPIDLEEFDGTQPVGLLLNRQFIETVENNIDGRQINKVGMLGTMQKEELNRKSEDEKLKIDVGGEIWEGAKIRFYGPKNSIEIVDDLTNPTKTAKLGNGGEIVVEHTADGTIEKVANHSTVVFKSITLQGERYNICSNGQIRDLSASDNSLKIAETGHVFITLEDGSQTVVAPNQDSYMPISSLTDDATLKRHEFVILPSGHVVGLGIDIDGNVMVSQIYDEGSTSVKLSPQNNVQINTAEAEAYAMSYEEEGSITTEYYSSEGRLLLVNSKKNIAGAVDAPTQLNIDNFGRVLEALQKTLPGGSSDPLQIELSVNKDRQDWGLRVHQTLDGRIQLVNSGDNKVRIEIGDDGIARFTNKEDYKHFGVDVSLQDDGEGSGGTDGAVQDEPVEEGIDEDLDLDEGQEYKRSLSTMIRSGFNRPLKRVPGISRTIMQGRIDFADRNPKDVTAQLQASRDEFRRKDSVAAVGRLARALVIKGISEKDKGKVIKQIGKVIRNDIGNLTDDILLKSISGEENILSSLVEQTNDKGLLGVLWFKYMATLISSGVYRKLIGTQQGEITLGQVDAFITSLLGDINKLAKKLEVNDDIKVRLEQQGEVMKEVVRIWKQDETAQSAAVSLAKLVNRLTIKDTEGKVLIHPSGNVVLHLTADLFTRIGDNDEVMQQMYNLIIDSQAFNPVEKIKRVVETRIDFGDINPQSAMKIFQDVSRLSNQETLVRPVVDQMLAKENWDGRDKNSFARQLLNEKRINLPGGLRNDLEKKLELRIGRSVGELAKFHNKVIDIQVKYGYVDQVMSLKVVPQEHKKGKLFVTKDGSKSTTYYTYTLEGSGLTIFIDEKGKMDIGGGEEAVFFGSNEAEG